MAAKGILRHAVLAGLAGMALYGAFSAWQLHRADRADPHGDEMDRASERLRTFDAQKRNGADFAHLPTWDELSGPDPYVVASIPKVSRVVGLLRGDDAVVVLDTAMHEVERLPAPAAPVALGVADDGAFFVAGELATTLARFNWESGRLVASGSWPLDNVRAVRAVAAGVGNWVYIAEEREGRLIALRIVGDRIATAQVFGTCRGPIRAERIANRLIVDCVLDHRLILHRLESSGAPSEEAPIAIRQDGPIWSFAAAPTREGLFIAAGGVEDHPLDRTIGAFGYIDSFLFLYRVDHIDAPKPEVRREAVINLSELGVVTPKAIAIRQNPLAGAAPAGIFSTDGMRVVVAGYGSGKLVELSFPDGPMKRAVIHSADFLPGANSVAALDEGHWIFANPLLDAWVMAERSGGAHTGDGTHAVGGSAPTSSSSAAASNPDLPIAVPVVSTASGSSSGSNGRPIRDAAMRLGEALFFTTAMAPFNSADGPLSRFTCETCHYEGYVDGRTHHTGRDDVHAVTKPLLGLFNNRPHFSRALDPDLTAVAFNEFRVAGAKSGHDPWFSLNAGDAPWLRAFSLSTTSYPPEELRKALMSFLIAFQHRPNPAVLERTSFPELEGRGAAVFRDRCEGCHEARLVSDQSATRVPFERWESLVMAREGSIVWGKDVYAATGVMPYVHEKGARIPSLRRLYKKHPYFTNGSADTLDDVLARARFLPSGFQHDLPPADAKIDSALVAPEPAVRTEHPGKPENAAKTANAPLAAEIQLDETARRALLAFLGLL